MAPVSRARPLYEVRAGERLLVRTDKLEDAQYAFDDAIHSDEYDQCRIVLLKSFETTTTEVLNAVQFRSYLPGNDRPA